MKIIVVKRICALMSEHPRGAVVLEATLANKKVHLDLGSAKEYILLVNELTSFFNDMDASEVTKIRTAWDACAICLARGS